MLGPLDQNTFIAHAMWKSMKVNYIYENSQAYALKLWVTVGNRE